jgi:hypothetical protein
MTAMRDLLYLTADGLLEPLGFSQVVRVVEALAKAGWRYQLLSLEKPADLKDLARVRKVRARLEQAGVSWTFAEYQTGSGAAQAAKNEWALVRRAIALIERGKVRGIHARSYHGAMAALAARLAYGTPYLFDTRSYWFDERLEEGRWLTSPVRIGFARGLEHQLYDQANAVVTLTELHADDVRAGRFGALRGRPLRCIPTCADFDEFRRKPPEECRRVPNEIRARLSGRKVVGLVGSINRSYLIEHSLQLARRILERDNDSHLLILSKQQREYHALLDQLGIPAQRVTIAASQHEAMPEWLSLLHWGLMLLQPDSPAKRASMPTKLAEFFASEVRPVVYGGNSEIADWVRRCGTGVVLENVSDAELERIATEIAATPLSSATTRAGRAIAAKHFALEAGVSAYDQVLAATFGA